MQFAKYEADFTNFCEKNCRGATEVHGSWNAKARRNAREDWNTEKWMKKLEKFWLRTGRRMLGG